MTTEIALLPHPQKMTQLGGKITLSDQRLIALAAPQPAKLLFMARRIQETLRQYCSLNWDIVGGSAVPLMQIGLTITTESRVEKPQGYRLSITGDGLKIEANDEAGAFYGVLTLIQLVQEYGSTLPSLMVEDWPDFPVRGVMLDISRDKVPTMDTLYMLVDKLASWKINQFQLYTEHTFAYQRHPAVWAKASPMTAEQILVLDAYCKERFIDLVPNQNSFGHMHRWFEHDSYRAMAETESGFFTPWGEWWDYPFSLTPTSPDSLPFLEGLYDELLPNFTSRYFNVGCDETFDLGQGRSKERCEQVGVGPVYLEFLLDVYKRVKQRDHTMQFWADIVGHHPELVPQLPHDLIALEWGYEDIHPFEERCSALAVSGIPFYVCPGTSSWTCIGGRTDNAKANIRNAVENGLKYGAQGILNTDWGDWGHWQTLPISYLGFAYGAALSWAYQPNVDMNLPMALDRFVFEDKADVMGKLAYDLGNTYQQPRVPVINGSILFWAYHLPLNILSVEAQGRLSYHRHLIETAENAPQKLCDTLEYIDATMAPLAQEQMICRDAALISEEFSLTADLLRHGAKRLLLILGDPSINRDAMRAELAALEERYRAQWLERNRPGGLEDSAGRITAARAAYV